jgi:alkanesulfonate monooxygenase SsuD/methylene tetrahydromethanopterin reductase-like flavin-dependent oxidoreductase (luciferase family)
MAEREVRWGLSLPNRGVLFGMTTVAELLELSEMADASGFYDSVWVGDSLLAKPRLEAISLLSAIAARTRRVKLGPACMASFPLRNALVLASQWATLDLIADGRTILVVCLGGNLKRGGAFATEYETMQVDPRSRVGRMEEGIAVLRALWQDEAAEFHGKHYDFSGVAFQPRPTRPGGIPIWIASNPDPDLAPAAYERALRRVAHLSDGWMTTVVDVETFERNWRAIQAMALAAGRDPGALDSSIHQMVNINDDPEAAVAESKRFLDIYYTTEYSRDVLDVWVAYGPPEMVAEKLLPYVQAGCQTPVLRFSAYDQKGQMRRFLDEVAPRLANARVPVASN